MRLAALELNGIVDRYHTVEKRLLRHSEIEYHVLSTHILSLNVNIVHVSGGLQHCIPFLSG